MRELAVLNCVLAWKDAKFDILTRQHATLTKSPTAIVVPGSTHSAVHNDWLSSQHQIHPWFEIQRNQNTDRPREHAL